MDDQYVILRTSATIGVVVEPQVFDDYADAADYRDYLRDNSDGNVRVYRLVSV